MLQSRKSLWSNHRRATAEERRDYLMSQRPGVAKFGDEAVAGVLLCDNLIP